MQKTDQLWTSLKQTFAAPEKRRDSIEQPLDENVVVDTFPRRTLLPRQSIEPDPPTFQIDASLRGHLRQRCLELYIGGRSISSSYLALHLHPTTSTSTHNTLTLAIDALCFGVIGASFPETNLSQDATVRYSQASNALLRRINMTMGRSTMPNELEDILITTTVLAECTYLEPFRAAEGDLRRYCGLLINLVRRYGIPSTSPMTQRYWLERLFCAALLAGDSITSSLVRSQGTPTEISFLESYVPTAIELLEEAKVVLKATLRNEQARMGVLKLLSRLGDLIASIKRLHFRWSSETPFLYRVSSIKTFQDFHVFHSNTTTPFELAYRFRISHDELEFRASNLCILEISQATISIYSTRPELSSNAICQLQLNSAREDAKNAADTICMLIPRLLEPDNGLSNIISSAMLSHFASAFYRKYEFEEKLDWCETVKRVVQTRFNVSFNDSSI